MEYLLPANLEGIDGVECNVYRSADPGDATSEKSIRILRASELLGRITVESSGTRSLRVNESRVVTSA